MKRVSFLYLSAIAIFGHTACSDKETTAPREQTLPVESIEASTSINLADRNNWHFFLGGSEYSYEINGDVITATPKNEAYRFSLEKDDNGYTRPASAMVQFFAPGFYHASTCGECPPKPNISDQSTAAKLLNADILYGRFTGLPAGNLTGIRLVHQNALLDFDVKDMPPGAVIDVISYGPVAPFREGTDHYKAVVLTSSTAAAYVNVKTADGTYRKEISNRNHWEYILPDTHYRFTVRFDADKKEVLIENLTTTSWSEE